MADGDPAGAVDHLNAAPALWRGRPFAELTGEAAAPVVAELEELRWEATSLFRTRPHWTVNQFVSGFAEESGQLDPRYAVPRRTPLTAVPVPRTA